MKASTLKNMDKKALIEAVQSLKKFTSKGDVLYRSYEPVAVYDNADNTTTLVATKGYALIQVGHTPDNPATPSRFYTPGDVEREVYTDTPFQLKEGVRYPNPTKVLENESRELEYSVEFDPQLLRDALDTLIKLSPCKCGLHVSLRLYKDFKPVEITYAEREYYHDMPDVHVVVMPVFY